MGNIHSRTLLERAQRDFPAVFSGRPKPLAIGIFWPINAVWTDVSKSNLGRFLNAFCKSRGYLEAVAAGGPRYYLDGSVDGEVSGEEQTDAQRRLEARHERNLADFKATCERHRRWRQERTQARKAATKTSDAPVEKAAPVSRRPILCLPAAGKSNRQTREIQVVIRHRSCIA
jgi:sRNA-binding protein